MKIHHHLGLGDHIVCNGLIRRIRKQTDVTLVVKNENLHNVSRMFKDIEIDYCLLEPGEPEHGTLGWNWGGDRSTTFDEAFYKQAKIPFIERWNSFYVERDYEKERRLSKHLELPSKFCLVHDTASTGKVDIDLKTKLPIIRVCRTPVEDSIFDWMGVIEKATEIYCINSSFIHLVDSMCPTAKLYFHNHSIPFIRKLNWEIIYAKNPFN
jgi:hypothetical protein